MNPLINAMQNTGKMSQMLTMLRQGNPDQIAAEMMRSNPNFRQFMEANRGKSPEQVASENGLDLNKIRNMLR